VTASYYPPHNKQPSARRFAPRLTHHSNPFRDLLRSSQLTNLGSARSSGAVESDSIRVYSKQISLGGEGELGRVRDGFVLNLIYAHADHTLLACLANLSVRRLLLYMSRRPDIRLATTVKLRPCLPRAVLEAVGKRSARLWGNKALPKLPCTSRLG